MELEDIEKSSKKKIGSKSTLKTDINNRYKIS